jgi:hypothetical protein
VRKEFPHSGEGNYSTRTEFRFFYVLQPTINVVRETGDRGIYGARRNQSDNMAPDTTKKTFPV